MINKQKIEEHFRGILIALGENPDREGLKETPKRVANAYAEIFDGLNYTNEEIAKMYDKGFTDEDIENSSQGFGEFVLVKDITTFSMCEHHILPAQLKVSIAYIPNEKVVGISKLPRIAKMVSRRLQLQERIGRDIAEVMQIIAGTEDVAVIISGTHSCMTMRGVQDVTSKTETAFFGGKFKDNLELRRELLLNICGGK